MATDPKYAAGQVVGGRTICGAKKRSTGDPCGAPPRKGATRCARHGANARQVQLKAKRDLARQEMIRAMTTLGLPVDIDPAKALLDEIARTNGAVLWLRGKVQELEPEQLAWGKTEHQDGIGPQGVVDVTTEKAAPSVWYDLYMTERKHLAQVSAIALRAGIEERRIRLAESQGDLVAGAIRNILDALGLTDEQLARVPEIVPRALRALQDGAIPGELVG